MEKQINSGDEKKVKVGLVQISNSFTSQTYFPYSLGCLQAYAQKHIKRINDFEFMPAVYKEIPLRKSLERLSESEIIFFSTYVWNTHHSLEIAKEIKKDKPESTIVFGGHGVPKREIEKFLRRNKFIDIACVGEGEMVFSSILENYEKRNWGEVPSISYLHEGIVISNSPRRIIRDLDEIPSPYLSGVFDSLMEENPQQTWLGLWETNRGCPFSCSFCEWGEEDYKIRSYDIETLSKEVDWFSENKIEFIFCCDANFGILERDIKIAEKVAQNKRKYGYPKRLSVQNTKNSTERSYQVQKILAESGLSKGVNLAFQSLNPETLKSIGRKNISTASFQELQRRFNNDRIETFSDIILGLPNETYKTFVDGISSLIEGGQKNRIQFINLSILPNSEMANPEYQKKYGLNMVKSRIVNLHGSLGREEIAETQNIVTGTDAMPPEDWVKTRIFGWMASLLYFDKLLQIPFTVLNKEYSVSYKELIESFFRTDKQTPIISDINASFARKAREIQKGGPEFCESDWLNVWWPPDELALIELCTQEKLDEFYQESEQILKNLGGDIEPIRESISLNRSLIKLPFKDSDLTMKLSYNLLDVYTADFWKPGTLKRIDNQCEIDRTSERWDSWDDWCQKVVWYGNKKGEYIYSCKSI